MADLGRIRAALPTLQSIVYLNSGTAGPLPAPVARAVNDALAEDEIRGRASGRRFAKIHGLLGDCRAAFAGLLNVAPEEIALTSGTTEGLSIILDRLDFKPGDRIVTSDLEHPDVVALVAELQHRHEVEVVTVAIAQSDDDEAVVAGFTAAVQQGSRLVLVSHVAFNTGRVLPVAAIAARAHAAGALVLVDAAQSVGAITVDVDALGADFCAFPGQKWLMGPEGSGGLVIRRAAQGALAHRDSSKGASAFERGTASKQTWAGVKAALEWRASLGEETELAAAISSSAASLRAVLEDVSGVEVITPATGAGLLAYRQAGLSAQEALGRLSAQRIAARDIPGTDWVRLSGGIFVDDTDIQAVSEALRGER